jgi:4-hydroxybenzoate polyprenyltransferase
MQGKDMLRVWFQALRIKHWVKNFFVLAPFLLGAHFGLNEYLPRALEGAFLFCLMSSAVYLFNDVVDARADQKHPIKRNRPIASGKISPVLASGVYAGLLALSLLGAFRLSFPFAMILCLYAANNVLYSFFLKKKTVLDVMSIAIGFVMRVFAGGFLVEVDVSNWLVICVFSLSLLIGFGKRRSEFEDLGEAARLTRRVNESYSIPKLNVLLGSSASIAILAYMLYAVSPETRLLHGTDKIIFTTPLVVYCIYRFTLKVQEGERGEPVELVLGDQGFVFAGLLWLISMIYLAH